MGTIIWASPTGHTYVTYPASLHFFRNYVNPLPRSGTATNRSSSPPTAADGRATMMPKRRHTRAHNTAKAKAAERKLNDARVAERTKPPPL